jgi:hypothetical protein
MLGDAYVDNPSLDDYGVITTDWDENTKKLQKNSPQETRCHLENSRM